MPRREARWRDSPRRICIEFVGLPGAGKSTIARTLARHLNDAGYECLDSPTFAHAARKSKGRIIPAAIDLVGAVRFTYASRRLWAHVLRRSRGARVLPNYWRLMRIWAALTRMAKKGNSGEPSVIILDQGILQSLRAVFVDPIDEATETQLTMMAVRSMRDVLPEIVAVVGSVPEGTAAGRMRSRPFQRTSFDHLEGAELEAALTPRRRYAERVLPSVLEEAGIQVLVLDGTVEPEQNASRVLAQFKKSLSRSSLGDSRLERSQ